MRNHQVAAIVADATSAGANFALGTLSRIDDSTGIRTQRPAVRQPVSNSLTARSQYLQGEPLDDSPIPNCSMRGVALTDPDKHFLTVLRQASAKALRGAWTLDTPRLGRRVSNEPCEVTGLGLCSAATVLACSLLKSRKMSTGTPS